MRTNTILACAAACWCGAILGAPAAAGASDPLLRAAGGAVFAGFSTVCHQWDSHSFHLFGHQLPVCIRCSAIYFSFFAGIVLYPSIGRKAERVFGARTLMAAAAAGMVVDVAASIAGIAPSSTATRLITGGAFGLLSAFVLTPVLQDCIAAFLRRAPDTHRT